MFEPVKDEQSQKDFKEANDAAIKAVKEFDAWLGEQEKTANDDFALGPDKFKAMLKQTEGVDIDLAKLEEIAKADLQRNTDALKTECDKWAPGKTLDRMQRQGLRPQGRGQRCRRGRDRPARRSA